MKYFILFLLTMFNISIYSQNGFEITGTIKNLSDGSLVSIQSQNVIIDSCYIKNNQFKLKGNIDIEPSDVLIVVKEKEATYYAPLFIGNEKISINASINEFPYDLKITGSIYDNERFNYMQKVKKLHKEKESVLNVIDSLKHKNLWNDKYESYYFSENNPKGLMVLIDDKYQTTMIDFINDNINSYFALKLLDMAKQSFTRHEISTIFKKIDPKFDNYNYVSIKNYINNLDLEPGDSFINFKAFDIDNNEVEFSNLFKDKYVLLNFSSLYCEWCEKALPSLNYIQNEFQNELDIIVFYVDEEPNGQTDFLKKQSEKWKTIWDPNRHFSDYMLYKIKSTPTFYFFNKNGILIEKIEGYKNLSEKISTVLN